MASISAEGRSELIALYVTMFNAAPSAANLSAIVGQREGGASLVAVANTLAASPDFARQYPGFLTADEFANRLATNMLGSEVSAATRDWAVNYVRSQLTSGRAATAVVTEAVQALRGTTNTEFANAKALLANKVEVASYYAISKEQPADSQVVMIGVTSTASTVVSAKTAIDSIASVVAGQTFTLTTSANTGALFTGGAGDDSYNGDLSGGNNTLNALDRLDGGAGTDTLNAVLASDVTPASIANIENIVATASGGARELNLVNAPGVRSVSSTSSSGGVMTVSGIAAGASLAVNSQSVGATFNYADTSGTQSIALGVAGVTGAAPVTVNGVETIAVTATGSASTYQLSADALTSVSFAGSAAQTVTLAGMTGTSSFNAGAATGAVNLTLINQSILASTTRVTVTGGTGNDTLTVGAHTQSDLNVSAGAGNDTVSHSSVSTTDTLSGGDGTDTLSTTMASANAIDASAPLTRIITGFERITITDAFDGTLSLSNIDTGLVQVNLADGASGAGALMTGGDAITGPAGTLTVNVGGSSAGNATTMGGALTVTDTGTATTDSVIINNTAVNTTTALGINVFNAQNITSTGYENVTIGVGSSGTTAPASTIGTLTITPDDLTAAISLTLTGGNDVTISSVTSTGTGRLTIDASAVNAGTDSPYVQIDAVTLGTGGTASIIGSAGNDSITSGTVAQTISGGAGNDTITGGTAADNISGDAGNDTITDGAGGNDTIAGGDGNDTITVTGTSTVSVDGGAGNDTINIGSVLSALDTVSGGDGTDTLRYSSAVTADVAVGVAGFETLRADAALTQDMVQFVNNAGFTRLINQVAGAVTFNNVGSAVTSFTAGVAGSTTTIDRLLDTTSNSLSVSLTTATTTTALTASDEETITVSSSLTGAVTLTTLTADDLTTLNIGGLGAVTITNIANAANLAAINITTSAAVSVNGNQSTVNMTATGTSAFANTITGGSGNDVITGGSAADSLTGGGGADTVSGGNGDDILLGGSGADSITGGEGSDSVTGGTGNDTVVLTENSAVADTVVLSTAATNGVDTIVGFAAGAGADIIQFVNADTTQADAAGAGAFQDIAAVTLVNAAAYDLAAVINTATISVVELRGTTAANGDLGAATDGSELLKLLGTADSAATGITVDNNGDQLFLVAYDNGNAYLFHANSGADTTVSASEVRLVGILTGITVGAIADGDIVSLA